MNHEPITRPRALAIRIDIVLAALFGLFMFAMLMMATGGILISTITATLAIILFGMFHYLFWGHSLSKTVAPDRQNAEIRVRHDREESVPPDEWTLTINEQERNELIGALEEWSAETLFDIPATRQRNSAKIEKIQAVLDRLRGFGA